MRVLFAASECVPFAKIGGLADVVGTLPVSLAKLGVETGVIIPCYGDIPQEYRSRMRHVAHFNINLGWRKQYCGIEALEADGVDYYFVDNEYYYGGSGIYRDGQFEGERYAFFTRAVLEALTYIERPYVLHCNDWQTGLIPVLLKTQYSKLPLYSGIKAVFTIHNLEYQGVFPWDWINEMLGIGDKYFNSEELEFYGALSFLKGGLLFADYLTTVSPTYADEIQTPEFGQRLDGVLRVRKEKLRGILNGIDTEAFNPGTDKFIAAQYSIKDLSGKLENKRALENELGLEPGDGPVCAIVSRLASQKGFDIIESILEDIINMGMRVAVLGKGEDRLVQFFNSAQLRYKGKLRFRNEHNEALAHRMYAGSDMFLMPSLFEPCGLAQMIAMRYGTLPVVRETGGLKDTVRPYNEHTGEGNGFSFAGRGPEMLHVFRRALELYNDRPVWEKIMKQAMSEDFSWEKSALKYMEIYDMLFRN